MQAGSLISISTSHGKTEEENKEANEGIFREYQGLLNKATLFL